MRKTAYVVLVALSALVAAGCSTLNTFGAMLGSQVTFTQPQLQRALDRSFPKQYDKASGLIGVTLDNPSLSIPYDSSRLRLGLDASTAGPVTGSHLLGRIQISSGLRFDSRTLGLHLQDPVLEDVDTAAGPLDDATREVINAWLASYARNEPIYQLDSELVQRLASRRIGAAKIGNGVVVLDVGQ